MKSSKSFPVVAVRLMLVFGVGYFIFLIFLKIYFETEISIKPNKSSYSYTELSSLKKKVYRTDEKNEPEPTKLGLYFNGVFPLEHPLLFDLLEHTRQVFYHNCQHSVHTVMFIISDPTHLEMRDMIRRSYGRNRVVHKYKFGNNAPESISHCVLFSIGYRPDEELNQRVDEEARDYNDILRIPLLDQYRQTAHKIVLTLYLLDKIGAPFEFILKSDDDILLKVNYIVPYLYRLPSIHAFIGHVVQYAVPIRDPNNKWYVSYEDYSKEFYDPYLMGSCYIFRRSIIGEVVSNHYRVRLIPMEDIHVSYLVTMSGYKLSDTRRFYHCDDYHQCPGSFIIDIGREPGRRQALIDEFYNSYDHY